MNKDNRRIKVGVIGCGIISTAHLNAYSLFPEVEVAAVADIDEKAAKEKAGEFQTKYYLDYHQMLKEEKLDGVSVCVPQFLHLEVCSALIEKGINILCEKPTGKDAREAQEILARAKKKQGLILMTAYCWRFAEPIVKVKEFISQGRLGKLLMFRLRFGAYKYHYVKGVKGNWAANPPPQSDAGEVNTNRGSEESFDYPATRRMTGKAGKAKKTPNDTTPSEVQPSGKPRL